MNSASGDQPDTIRFGRFELRRAARRLVCEGGDVALGARAFDLLQALIERRDRIVDKDELLDIAWPGLVVEESNLTVQISVLRKALGPHAITTAHGRGQPWVRIDGFATPDELASEYRKPVLR